jgi:hypothetical protein
MTFGDLLEAGNGVWAVLSFWLSMFMLYHVLIIRVQRRITWAQLLLNFKLPLSMQVAVGTLTVAAAIFMTRVVLWYARYRHSGDLDLLMPESGVYLVGTLLGIVGILFILRSVSQPTFGHWPWVGALTSATVYIAWWSAVKF